MRKYPSQDPALKRSRYCHFSKNRTGEERKSVGLDPGGPVLNFMARGFMEGFKLRIVLTERGCRGSGTTGTVVVV